MAAPGTGMRCDSSRCGARDRIASPGLSRERRLGTTRLSGRGQVAPVPRSSGRSTCHPRRIRTSQRCSNAARAPGRRLPALARGREPRSATMRRSRRAVASSRGACSAPACGAAIASRCLAQRAGVRRGALRAAGGRAWSRSRSTRSCTPSELAYVLANCGARWAFVDAAWRSSHRRGRRAALADARARRRARQRRIRADCRRIGRAAALASCDAATIPPGCSTRAAPRAGPRAW